MRKFQGLKWFELTEEEKHYLYNTAIIDKDYIDTKTGICIVDFREDLSIIGRIIRGIEEDELIIDDNAILYNPVG